jgi:ribosomal protein S18 acetylase RimI-like enzyme
MLGIRPATHADLAAVQRLGLVTYRTHFTYLWQRPEEMEEFLAGDFSDEALARSLADARTGWLLALEDGRPVGYAKLNFDQTVPHSTRPGCELQKIYFLEECVGRGYGSRLLEHVMRTASERGQPYLWLKIVKDNDAAARFYARHGFTVVGESDVRSRSQTIELRVMGRELAAP